MSRQRIVGIWMAVAGVVAAIVAWVGVRAATNANDEAIYDAEISCLARNIVSGRSGPCDLPQTNSTPWVVLAIIGAVVFLAGIILTSASGRGSSTTTSPHHDVQLPGVPSQRTVQQRSVVNDRIRDFAQKDPDCDAIGAAVHQLERRQQRDVTDWLFVDGPAPLLVRLDGLSIMVGADIWQVLTGDVDHGKPPDGDVNVIRFGTTVLTNPRPAGQVSGFLQAVRSSESEKLNACAIELPRPPLPEQAPTTNAIWAAPVAAYVNEANDSAAGVRESLEFLEALWNDGLISDAEHASKRDRILDRL